MKIRKLIREQNGHYFAVFDTIPEITYEQIGSDYIGSAVNEDGHIIASHFLKKEPYGDAFAGRVITLHMKDGTLKDIQNHWFDYGPYNAHGKFMNIGAGTLKELQNCYVYFNYNIRKDTFEQMVNDYLMHDKLYTYKEVREWCHLQHTWYHVIANGKQIPFMMNRHHHVVERDTKKLVHANHSVRKTINGKTKIYKYLRFDYMENGRRIKIDASYDQTIKDTLPCTVNDRQTPFKP